MRPRQEVLQYADKIPEGCTLTVKCPFCTEDYERQNRPWNWKPSKSMSISREGYALLYHCFRASCSRGRGVIHILDGLHKAAIAKAEKQTASFSPKWYRYKTEPAQIENLKGSTTLTKEELAEQHVRYAKDRGTVVFPIFDHVGHEVGVVDRSYVGRDPKALTYWFSDVPKMHFPLEEATTSVCMLVEDIPSAIKATKHVTSVALLGTNLTSDCLMHLRGKFTTLYIALDEDATDKAIQMAKKYSIFFKEVIPVPLKKDIKNMNDEELDDLFGGL